MLNSTVIICLIVCAPPLIDRSVLSEVLLSSKEFKEPDLEICVVLSSFLWRSLLFISALYLVFLSFLFLWVSLIH